MRAKGIWTASRSRKRSQVQRLRWLRRRSWRSHTLSTRDQWFHCGPLLASHLTWFFPGLFRLRARPWLLTTAARGGLEPAPVSRFRGAYPHQLSSYTHWALLGPLRSWRTVIGVSEKTVKRDWSTAKAWLRAELRGRKEDLQ